MLAGVAGIILWRSFIVLSAKKHGRRNLLAYLIKMLKNIHKVGFLNRSLYKPGTSYIVFSMWPSSYRLVDNHVDGTLYIDSEGSSQSKRNCLASPMMISQLILRQFNGVNRWADILPAHLQLELRKQKLVNNPHAWLWILSFVLPQLLIRVSFLQRYLSDGQGTYTLMDVPDTILTFSFISLSSHPTVFYMFWSCLFARIALHPGKLSARLMTLVLN